MVVNKAKVKMKKVPSTTVKKNDKKKEVEKQEAKKVIKKAPKVLTEEEVTKKVVDKSPKVINREGAKKQDVKKGAKKVPKVTGRKAGEKKKVNKQGKKVLTVKNVVKKTTKKKCDKINKAKRTINLRNRFIINLRKKGQTNSPIHKKNEELDVSEWLPKKGQKGTEIASNSWFSIVRKNNPKRKKPVFVNKQIPSIPIDSYKQQSKTINKINANKKATKKTQRKPGFITTKMVKLYLTQEQKNMLKPWFNLYIDIYNKTIDYINEGSYDNDGKVILAKIKKKTSFYDVRKRMTPIVTKMNEGIGMYKHMMDEAVKQAVSNTKTCISLYEKNYIKKFRIRKISHDKPRKILIIENSLLSEKKLLKNGMLGTVEKSSPIDKGKTVTLQYNSVKNEYIVFVPIVTKVKTANVKTGTCGVDPGSRTFLTTFSVDQCYAICDDSLKDFKYHWKKIDKIDDILRARNTKGKITTTVSKRSALKKKRRAVFEDIRNLVKDLHYKSAHFLVHNYDKIYLGKLSTSVIMKGKLSYIIKRHIQTLSHYAFRCILTHMCHKYGSKLYLTNEYLTSQSCSSCGRLVNVGSSDTFSCPKCKLITGRDENAAKNILKMGISDGVIMGSKSPYNVVNHLTITCNPT